MASHKVIISCAVTGSIHTPSMSPHLPVTPADIAQSALEFAEPSAKRAFSFEVIIGHHFAGQ